MIRWLVLLIGCAGSGTSPDPASGPLLGPVFEGPTADDLSRVGVRGTARSVEMLAEQLQTIDLKERDQAVQSLQVLAVSCPYTRSALQLPFALQRMAQGIDVEQLDPLVQQDWAYLLQGLETHVALLEALGVDLAEPQPGDPLEGWEPMISRAALARSDDPIHVTRLMVDQLPLIAKRTDDSTRHIIAFHSEQVERATGIGRVCPRGPWAVFPGQPWTLGLQLNGWHDALRKVRPFVLDPDVGDPIDQAIELLQAYAVNSTS